MSADREAVARLEALVHSGLTIASELSLPVVLQTIVDVACRVAGARYGALGVIGSDGKIAEFITHGVSDEERARIGSLPEGHGILGVLITDARPLRLKKIQDDPRSYGFPREHPPMTTFLGVPVMVRGLVFGNLYLTEKIGGEEFTAQDEDAVMTLATQAGVAIENARLFQAAQANQLRLAAVNQVTEAILQRRPADDVLRSVARYARELVGADLATVATPADEEDELVLSVADGAEAERLRGMRFALGGSLSGEVMRTRRALIVDDVTTSDHRAQPVVGIGTVGPAILVPLGVHSRTFGTLLVANLKGGRVFDDDDLGLVQMFASQAAVALEYARVREELERMAILEDRERIAKELHDGVVQSLFAVGMSLQAAETMVDDPAAVRTRIEGAVADIDGAIRDLRNYIFGLRPGELADWQLTRTLRELADDFAGAGVAIEVSVDPAAAAALAARAFDVVQAAREALSNALRHSGASSVTLRLVPVADGVVLEVVDDGTGFDPEAVRGKGHGLGNLRARAASLGGRLSIESGAEGTTVRIEVR